MAELVAPIVPDAQKNRAPDLLLEGFRTGLAGATQLAQLRRQSEQDVARLALQERLAEQEHNLSAQRMSQEYELRDRSLRVEEELLEPRKAALEAQAEYTKISKGAAARQSAAKIATLNDFNRQVARYKLDDPNPRNPVEYYASARRLSDEFGWADIPVIKHTLKQIDQKTKEHTVPLSINMSFTDESGEKTIKAVSKRVPIGEIVEGIKDPTKYPSVMKAIERSGLLKDDAPGNKQLRAAIQEEIRKVESGKETDFSRGKNRVFPGNKPPWVEHTVSGDPMGVHTELDSDGTINTYSPPSTIPPAPAIAPTSTDEPAETEDVDESDLFGSIGTTEKYLSQARAALARKADPRAVAERLKSFGVDPSQLWAT